LGEMCRIMNAKDGNKFLIFSLGMAKISKIDTTRLRNEAYFQFHTEFRDLVVASEVEVLKIELQFNTYKPLYNKVNEAIKKVAKSAFTAKIHEADRARCEIWAGMTEINFASLKHFNPEIRAAAARLQIVFDSCEKVARKYAKGVTTAEVYNILKELDKHKADMALVGLLQWAIELKIRNATLENLVKGRSEEAAYKSNIVLKKARRELDVVYRTIVERVNALIVVEGEAAYERFAKSLNTVVEKYAEKHLPRRQNV